MLVLMQGDRQVSTKGFARELKVKTMMPSKEEAAHKHTESRAQVDEFYKAALAAGGNDNGAL